MKIYVVCLIMGWSSLVFGSDGQFPFMMPSAQVGEREVFNWEPSYTINLPAFNSDNYVFLRARAENANGIPPFNLELFSGSRLIRRPYKTALLRFFPAGTTIESTIGASGRRYTSGVFNSENEYFTLLGIVVKTSQSAKSEKAWILIWTKDNGLTWGSYLIARESEFENSRCPSRFNFNDICGFPHDVEMARNFSPAAIEGNMPSLLLYHQTGRMRARVTDKFDQIGRLSLLLISRNSSNVVSSARYMNLGSRVLGIGSHSGGSAKIIRYNNKIYIAWIAGTTNPNLGSPTIVAAYDVTTQQLTKRTVAHVFPSNDSHNQPGLTMVSQGVLHLITGAHGSRMLHTYTLQRNSILSWSIPRPMRLTNEQTYISMVADSEDNIHAVYRRMMYEKNNAGEDVVYNRLVYQKFDGQIWSEPVSIVSPNINGYFIYYQQMTIDRNDNLYLSYSRWSTKVPYCEKNNDGKCGRHLIPQFKHTALIKLEKGTNQWRLVNNF